MVCPEDKELSNYLFATQNQIKSSRKANNQQETGIIGAHSKLHDLKGKQRHQNVLIIILI